MAQDFDNLSKRFWTDHPEDLSRFVTGEDDVEIGKDINTEQHLVVARHTDITKWARRPSLWHLSVWWHRV